MNRTHILAGTLSPKVGVIEVLAEVARYCSSVATLNILSPVYSGKVVLDGTSVLGARLRSGESGVAALDRLATLIEGTYVLNAGACEPQTIHVDIAELVGRSVLEQELSDALFQNYVHRSLPLEDIDGIPPLVPAEEQAFLDYIADVLETEVEAPYECGSVLSKAEIALLDQIRSPQSSNPRAFIKSTNRTTPVIAARRVQIEQVKVEAPSRKLPMSVQHGFVAALSILLAAISIALIVPRVQAEGTNMGAGQSRSAAPAVTAPATPVTPVTAPITAPGGCPEQSPEWLTKAIALNKAGKNAEAFTAIDRWMAANGESSEGFAVRSAALTEQGVALLAMHNPKVAIQRLSDAIRQSPAGREAFKAYGLRAEGWLELGRIDSAMRDLKEAVSLAPPNSAEAGVYKRNLQQCEDKIQLDLIKGGN